MPSARSSNRALTTMNLSRRTRNGMDGGIQPEQSPPCTERTWYSIPITSRRMVKTTTSSSSITTSCTLCCEGRLRHPLESTWCDRTTTPTTHKRSLQDSVDTTTSLQRRISTDPGSYKRSWQCNTMPAVSEAVLIHLSCASSIAFVNTTRSVLARMNVFNQSCSE